jgi:transcriptional regulator with XRE-family HTH domain
MAKPRKVDQEELEALKKASGWYLRAWRLHRNLSLDELANEVGTSKGTISELETGKPKKDGSPPLRFNRDWVDRMSKALNTTGGYLIDVNPFAVDDAFTRLREDYNALSEDQRLTAANLIAALRGR